METLVLLIGAAFTCYGVELVYPPAGTMLGGALLVVGVLLRARGHR